MVWQTFRPPTQRASLHHPPWMRSPFRHRSSVTEGHYTHFGTEFALGLHREYLGSYAKGP